MAGARARTVKHMKNLAKEGLETVGADVKKRLFTAENLWRSITFAVLAIRRFLEAL